MLSATQEEESDSVGSKLRANVAAIGGGQIEEEMRSLAARGEVTGVSGGRSSLRSIDGDKDEEE